jgi:hypothetical protein
VAVLAEADEGSVFFAGAAGLGLICRRFARWGKEGGCRRESGDAAGGFV